MGDLGNGFRDHRDYRAKKRLQMVPCINCERNLLPGETCYRDGYQAPNPASRQKDQPHD